MPLIFGVWVLWVWVFFSDSFHVGVDVMQKQPYRVRPKINVIFVSNPKVFLITIIYSFFPLFSVARS